MFEPTKVEANVRLERTIKLREEEQKGRAYNIVSGMDEGHEKWLQSYGLKQTKQGTL